MNEFLVALPMEHHSFENEVCVDIPALQQRYLQVLLRMLHFLKDCPVFVLLDRHFTLEVLPERLQLRDYQSTIRMNQSQSMNRTHVSAAKKACHTLSTSS